MAWPRAATPRAHVGGKSHPVLINNKLLINMVPSLCRIDRVVVWIDFWTDPAVLTRLHAEFDAYRKSEPRLFGDFFDLRAYAYPTTVNGAVTGGKIELVSGCLGLIQSFMIHQSRHIYPDARMLWFFQ